MKRLHKTDTFAVLQYSCMVTTTRGTRSHIPIRSVQIVVAIALILLPTALSVASSHPSQESTSAAVPTASMPRPQALDECGDAEFFQHPSGNIEVWLSRAESTAALRAAVWVSTAVIAALSVAVVGQARRCLRPARSGSKRWEAGWAGQVRHRRRVAAGSCAKVQGG